MSDPSISTADYWNTLYKTGENRWDKGACAPPIARQLGSGLVPKGARIGVLGSGPGHEAIAAAKLGYRVTAIDFADEACRTTAANAQAAKVEVEALQADVFELWHRRPEHFDALIEHTCFCAI